MLFKVAREKLHLSKKYVCNYLMCSEYHLDDIENGKMIPTIKELIALEELYGIKFPYKKNLSHDEIEIQNLIKFRNNFKSS